MDKVAVADALERAADLYEAEEIGWCKFRWIERGLAVADCENPLGLPVGRYYHTGHMTMCAEGAILKAVGFDNEWIAGFGDGLLPGTLPGGRYEGAFQTFQAAVTAVESRLPPLDPTSQALLTAYPLEGDEGWDNWSLAGWNDQGAKDKAEVVELFKATAKDLRNG